MLVIVEDDEGCKETLGASVVDYLEKDDHEATAALLMLNTDRRSWSSNNGSGGGGGGAGRSMSVRDLLSG